MEIDPNKLWIGDVILVASGNKITEAVQKKLGYGDSSKWTHVAGCIGAYDLIEGQQPKSRVCDIEADYVNKNIEVKVLRKNWEVIGDKAQAEKDRIKVALWWASMNNLQYDMPQLAWFLFALRDKAIMGLKNIFNSKSKLICSELIADGFMKQGYNLFDKPGANVLPADFDNLKGFSIVEDIWLNQ